MRDISLTLKGLNNVIRPNTVFITEDFGASDLPIIQADEEDHFEVEKEMKQLSATTINHHATASFCTFNLSGQ